MTLAYRWLKSVLATWYGLDVTGASQVRDAWKVETFQGPKCFKQVKTEPHIVNFTALAVQYVIERGFTATVPFTKTATGSYSVSLPEGTFYLTDWIPGREGEIGNLQDAIAAAKVLARFHQASLGFTVPFGCKSREAWGTLPLSWQKHRQQLDDFKQLASQRQDSFSKLFLETSAWYISRSEHALDLLSHCHYEDLVKAAKGSGSLCHRDFTYHNLIRDETDKINIIDFDYCSQDIRVYDVGRYARKVCKSFAWRLHPVKLMLQAYDEVSPLSNNEIIFILAFLYFPQKYWRLAHRYYSAANASPEAFTDQLQLETADQQQEETFLLEFSLEVSREVSLRR